MLKLPSRHIALLSCLGLLGGALSTQVNSAEKPSKKAIKEMLAPKEGEASSEESAKDIFSKTEDNYSLPGKGKYSASLNANYSYYQSNRPTFFLIDGRFTMLDITSDSERTLSTTVSFDYGLTKNLSLDVSLPFYIKDDELNGITTTDIGDAQASVRWQPRPSEKGAMTSLMFLSLSVPTGINPYEIEVGKEQSTGQGFPSVAIGSTFFKVFDPLIGFGSASFTFNPETDGFNQSRTFFLDNASLPGVLTEVQPGHSVSTAIGLSYAITYDFTVTVQYQHSIVTRSTFVWRDAELLTHQTKSATYDSGSAKLTTSWKGEGGKYLNLYFTLPVTDGQADIIIGVSMPLFPG